MIRFLILLPALLFLLHSGAVSQKRPLLKKDLQKEWMICSSDAYISFSPGDAPASTIYFFLDAKAFRGDYLQVKSMGTFAIFVNGQLFLNTNDSARLFLDSLYQFQEGNVLVAVNRKEGITDQTLSTILYSDIEYSSVLTEPIPLRKSTYFRDFVIIATLFLFVFFILMIRLNPRLSSDYFSVSRIFLLREADDDQFYMRITSANILFYIFTSLVLAFFFMLVQQFASPLVDLAGLSTSTFGSTLLVWLRLSLIILAVLFLKIVLVIVISALFDSGDSAGYHFFNFVRLLLVVSTLLSLVLAGYYMLNGTDHDFYYFLFKLFGWATGIFIIILFFKLRYRVRFSAIHLFSYICATEILPLLLIVKILYK